MLWLRYFTRLPPAYITRLPAAYIAMLPAAYITRLPTVVGAEQNDLGSPDIDG